MKKKAFLIALAVIVLALIVLSSLIQPPPPREIFEKMMGFQLPKTAQFVRYVYNRVTQEAAFDVRLSPAEYDLLLRGEVPRLREDMGPEKQALLTEIRLRGLKPVVVVTYERIPFIYSGGNVRVTFDRKLTSSPDVARFLTGDYRQRPVFPSGQSLLEVKWDEVFPRHLKEILRTDSLLWTAFSKYYLCRRVHM